MEIPNPCLMALKLKIGKASDATKKNIGNIYFSFIEIRDIVSSGINAVI